MRRVYLMYLVLCPLILGLLIVSRFADFLDVAVCFVAWLAAWTIVFDGRTVGGFSSRRLIFSAVASSLIYIYVGGIVRRTLEYLLYGWLLSRGLAVKFGQFYETKKLIDVVEYVFYPAVDGHRLRLTLAASAFGVAFGFLCYTFTATIEPPARLTLFVARLDGLFTAAFASIGLELGLEAVSRVAGQSFDSLADIFSPHRPWWVPVWIFSSALITAVGGGFIQKYVIRYKFLKIYTPEELRKWLLRRDPPFALALLAGGLIGVSTFSGAIVGLDLAAELLLLKFMLVTLGFMFAQTD